MDERVLFLSRLEFAVLLLTENITEILCFPLPNEQNVNEKQMIKAVYELVCMGCIQVDEVSIKLTDSMKKIVEELKETKRYLMIESGNLSHPQKICYIGKRVIVLEAVQEEGKAFRLSSMEQQEFWTWLEDSMEIPETVIKEKTEAEQLLSYHEMVQKEREALIIAYDSERFQTISEWMDQVETLLGETVYLGIRFIKKEGAETELDLLLCQGSMNLWFLWRKPRTDFFREILEEERLHIEPDSAELRQEISNMLWREEK